MVNYYLDTSAALKAYVVEPGSAWLMAQIPTATLLVSSQLLAVEVISALNRRVRDNVLTFTEYQRIRDIFHEDCRDLYQVTPLTPAIIKLAGQVLERCPLRSYDAVHLATALTVQQSLQRRSLSSLVFLSADTRLNDAAQAEGLSVDNPTHHP